MDHHSNKAQKGWLSRWTRKQWSRHWFVLKNGSLTYYRGPAAELCSFLDGVLDLSLIKHIEVQQNEDNRGQQNHNLSQQQQQHQNYNHHHHHISSQNGNSSNNNPQFTFTLKMWNGECHLLGAGSAAERSLWLEAINACTSGDADDDAATDSASSSDSSPTSNLSARSADIGRVALSRYQLSNRNDTATCLEKHQQAISRHSSLIKGQQTENCQAHAIVGRQLQDRSSPMNNLYLVNNMVTCSSQTKLSEQHQSSQQVEKRTSFGNNNFEDNLDQKENHQLQQQHQQQQSQEHDNQAFKRRLMCVQAHLNRADSSNEPKLITRQAKIASLHLMKPSHLRLQSGSSDEDEDEDEDSSSLSSDSETSTSIADDDDDNGQVEKDGGDVGGELSSNLGVGRSDDCIMLMESDHPAMESTQCGIIKQTGGQNYDLNIKATPSSELRQKKRVTFDLSEHLSGTSSDSSSDSSLSSSSSVSSSEEEENDVEREEDHAEPNGESSNLVAEEQLVDLTSDRSDPIDGENKLEETTTEKIALSDKQSATITSPSLLGNNISSLIRLQSESIIRNERHEADVSHSLMENTSDEQQPMDTTSTTATDEALITSAISEAAEEDLQQQQPPVEELSQAKSRNEELMTRLEEAQASVESLERRLSTSYVSYGQLEESYNRLQGELTKIDESHKNDIARLQTRVEELTRDLAISEMRLVATSDKLQQFEDATNNKKASALDRIAQVATEPCQQATLARPTNGQVRPPNWLKGSNLHHQPLLLMHHVKHTLAVNQQTLGLKLLNHSKQIQRKLNELELKVDKIQSTNMTGASLVNV